ncbi:MAG: SDR family oxidoreductase [Myxococcales bacterium]|nr:SDR family oxidoreductase [Myxococcales bacterium]
MPDGNLSGKTFVITGANTGIGRATAEELARRGGRVVFACRSQDKTQPVIDEIRAATGNEELVFVELALDDLGSVRRAAEQILESEPAIHVLINNAGLARVPGETQNGFERTFGVNHLGHFLFTQLLLDRLRASAPSRIVNVASGSHYQAKELDFGLLRGPTRTFSGLPEYAVSKLCNVLFTAELARRLDGTGVTTYSLHPGTIASDIWRSVPLGLGRVARLFMKSNEEGAETTLYCATDPALGEVSGRYYDSCREKRPSKLASDAELARKLWQQSSEWVSVD